MKNLQSLNDYDLDQRLYSLEDKRISILSGKFDASTINESEIDELLFLLKNKLKRVSPKIERFRYPKRIKVAYGGRGAGAKTWSIGSLLVQIAHVRKVRILCCREIQLSLSESVYRIIRQQVERLELPGWEILKDEIRSPVGSTFHFKGLKDLRASNSIKGFEDVDICWVEEASTVSNESWDILVPTIRKPGSEIWISFNRELERDPVFERFCVNLRDDCLVIALEPGGKDNPWWTAELQREMEEDFKRDPDLAEHVWHGLPRKQGQKSVMARSKIRGAMDRVIEYPVGPEEIGVDVARFGDDDTIMYRRIGLKVVEEREFKGQDTQEIARQAWDMARRDPTIPIKVDDSGVGGGVTDKLRDLGANVVPVNFGGSAIDQAKYTSTADEMWFTFPIDEADIPDDPRLMNELSGRQYEYTSKDQRKIESKRDYKKRCGKSPDKADALLLCFFNPQKAIGDVSEISASFIGL